MMRGKNQFLGIEGAPGVATIDDESNGLDAGSGREGLLPATRRGRAELVCRLADEVLYHASINEPTIVRVEVCGSATERADGIADRVARDLARAGFRSVRHWLVPGAKIPTRCISVDVELAE